MDQSDDDAEDRTEFNENLKAETFLGVKQLIETKGLKPEVPIVFVIKNIKLFSSSVLNDLIHIMKNYRKQYGLNFCLILGVQNNNKEEIHLRINIQNCTKLTVKNFFFPSMKQIIFQAIYQILLTKRCPLIFSQKVISNLIEQLNIYGTSVDKFRRILRLLIVEFAYETKYY